MSGYSSAVATPIRAVAEASLLGLAHVRAALQQCPAVTDRQRLRQAGCVRTVDHAGWQLAGVFPSSAASE